MAEEPATVTPAEGQTAEPVVPTENVVVGEYTWDDFTAEYGPPPEEVEPEDEIEPGPDRAELLGFDPDDIENVIHSAGAHVEHLADIVDHRTLDIPAGLDEDAFFSTPDGDSTIVSRYDLEKAVTLEQKQHFREEQRYWVNKPYSFVVIFHSTRENEKKYFAIEPYLTPIEGRVREFLSNKLRTSIKFSDEDLIDADSGVEHRRDVIIDETRALLDRYDLRKRQESESVLDRLTSLVTSSTNSQPQESPLPGVRPEPAIIEEDPQRLNRHQIEKLLYYFTRDFVGYERIDPIKHDINVEDISCDGWNSRVFVYHTDYEQLISNISHGKEELDNFVVKLAQRAGKGISKRNPQVDATLPDGSRSQLTLGREVSDHGTNYTIRQFKDVPFTPIDLINWQTIPLDQMAFLWLCIENNKSLLFAGGTASGKTTSLNAVSLFIPSNSKIVSIEDTREVELPQRNWIASVTRPSFTGDQEDEVDEFDLLEAALRQRPEYIVMGEVRGEEGRTLFQVMSTGHTTYTTFHADSVGEVLKRFTTDPINVSKTMFTALDLVSIQAQTRVKGRKVRRNRVLTEINRYDPDNDEINVQDIYQWQAERDEFIQMGSSNTLEQIRFDRGWTKEELREELFTRKVVLAYMIDHGIKNYAEVAATIQAFINDPDTVLTLLATDTLQDSLHDLRRMESVVINVDPEVESLVPRPDPDEDVRRHAGAILEEADHRLFDEYRDQQPGDIADALGEMEPAEDIEASVSDTTPDSFTFGEGG